MSDVPHAKMNAAVNIICKYVKENLLPGYSLELRMDSEDSSLTLLTPTGIEVESSATDYGYSAIISMCDLAREYDDDDGEEDEDENDDSFDDDEAGDNE